MEPPNVTSGYDSSEYNTTDYTEEDLVCSLQAVRDFSKLFVPITYSLVCVSGLLGNALVVTTFAFYKRAKSMTDVYLLNMAVADLLFVLTLPFWAVRHATGEWVFSNAACKLLKGVHAVNFHCGMLLLACVSVDRYVAIVQAAKSLGLRARARAHQRAICGAVWALSVLLSGSTVTLSHKYPLQGASVCEPRYGDVAEPVPWKLLVLALQLLFGFFVPLLFITFCYLLIVRTLLRAHSATRHRAIRVVAAVVLVFLACQVPHNVVLLVTAANLGRVNRSCAGERLLGYAGTLTEVLAFLRCCLNPVLYAFIGHKFRSYFLRVTRDVWCVRRARKAAGFSCARLHPDTAGSRQNTDTGDDNASSFTM